MISDIKVPQLSVNDATALLLEWMINTGEKVKAGEEICLIETSKVTQAIAAERDGYLRHAVGAGAELAVHGQLGWISDRPDEMAALHPVKPVLTTDTLEITNRARDLALALGIKVEEMPRKGTIIRERDIQEFAKGRPGMNPTIASAPAHNDLPEGLSRDAVDEIQPLPRAQRRVKEAMVYSLQTHAHSYVSMQVTIQPAQARVEEMTQKTGQAVRLNDFFIWATAQTLKHFPAFNGFFWKDQAVRYKGIHVGVAVDVDGTLLVPVVRDADTKPLEAIAAESGLLQMKVLRKTLAPAECEGSTFTITNLSGLGVQTFIPIIHGHESAILAVGQAVEGKTILGLSFDHRLHNGMQAARFLGHIKSLAENTPQGEITRG